VTDIARDLGAIFARRANETTDEDRFVEILLKASGLVGAGVPAELGARQVVKGRPRLQLR
jgi:hypothetical protein